MIASLATRVGLITLTACAPQYAPLPQYPVQVAIAPNLERLEREVDTDGDKKITVKDRDADGRRDPRFLLHSTDARVWAVAGTYALSNLFQELALARTEGRSVIDVDANRLQEQPSRRISRLIRERYWDGLTRRVDADHLGCVLPDDKVTEGAAYYLYVAANDAIANAYFRSIPSVVSCNSGGVRRELRVQVETLSPTLSPEYVATLDTKPGLLALATELREDRRVGIPFVVPGGRFNEMYGWDSYFTALGLLEDERVDLARAMVDNLIYEIRHYGKILNANRTYYLTRSQPPLLTSMALEVFARLPSGPAATDWLATALWASIDEYDQVWMSADRLTEIGLSRYYGAGLGPPPEVEPGHFDAAWARFAKPLGVAAKELERRYRAKELGPELQQPIDEFFIHDRCMRESGHDTSYRWFREGDPWKGGGDRCADFVTVDLNALLHKYEIDVARAIAREFGGTLKRGDRVERSEDWYAKAKRRRDLMRRFLWDDARAMFFDYDVVRQRRSDFAAATTLYPLWAVHAEDPATRILTQDEAARVIQAALAVLEQPGGLSGSSERSRGVVDTSRPARQWDYPNGWAPHQMIAWRGLANYGYREIADRLVYRWLYTITRNAVDYNGTIPEKFDVVARSHDVFAEYGNVGTRFEYITREGFGWMNASYQVGLQLLSPKLREKLDALDPP